MRSFRGDSTVQIETQSHLDVLVDYIHLNPVSAGLVRRAEDWQYSSYRDILGLRHGTLIARGLSAGMRDPVELRPLPKRKLDMIEGLTLEE